MRKIKFLCLSLIFFSCSSSNVPIGVFTFKEKSQKSEQKFTLAITSKISAIPTTQNTISVGGEILTQKYLDILKVEYQAQIGLLSIGELFKEDFYKKNNFHAHIPSPSDLNENKFFSLPYISTNLLPLIHNSKFKKILQKKIIRLNNIKVLILSINQLPLNFSKKYENMNQINFYDPVLSVLKNIRPKSRNNPTATILFLNNFDKSRSLESIIKKMPARTIDLIITNEEVTNSTNQNTITMVSKKSFLNILEFSIKDNRVSFLKYNKVKLCSHYYKSTNDCHSHDNQDDDDQTLIPARFLGHNIL